MLKLILYEWKKLWKNASAIKIILLFFILSGMIFQGQLNQDKEAHPVYLEFHNATDNMTDQEARQWLLEMQKKENSGYGEYKALLYLNQEISAISEYHAYRQAIQDRYEQSQSISIFAKDDGQNQYMERIAQKYGKLELKATMRRQPYQGLIKVLDSYVQYILAIVLLIYLVSVLFIQEQKNGKVDFAGTMFRGRTSLFFAKVCTVYGTLLVYLFGTFLIHMMLATRIYGHISMDAAIQSIPGFYSVPYAWSIREYIFVFILLQALALFLLTSVAVFLAKYFASGAMTTFGLGLVVVLSVFAQKEMNGNGMKAIFRLWNVWGILTGKSIIKNYELIQFGNLLINQNLGIIFCMIVAVGLLIIAAIHPTKGILKKDHKKGTKSRKPHGLIYYEMKKMWIYQGGVFFFLLCIFVQLITINQYKTYIGTDEFYYQTYIDEFGNKVTENTKKKIEEEKVRLACLEKELSEAENEVISYKLTQELECVGGFWKYVERVENLQSDKKPLWLLKDRQYELLFENTTVSRMMVILLCSSFAFLIPAIYQKEKESGMEVLQDTSWIGGRKLWCIKIGIVLLYSISFVLFSGIIIIMKLNSMYDLEWTKPVGCLPQYWNISIEIPIWGMFVLGVLTQCVTVTVMVVFLSACAKKVKNRHVLTGVVLGTMVVPVLLSTNVPVEMLNLVHHVFFVFTANLKMLVTVCLGLCVATYFMIRKEMKK